MITLLIVTWARFSVKPDLFQQRLPFLQCAVKLVFGSRVRFAQVAHTLHCPGGAGFAQFARQFHQLDLRFCLANLQSDFVASLFVFAKRLLFGWYCFSAKTECLLTPTPTLSKSKQSSSSLFSSFLRLISYLFISLLAWCLCVNFNFTTSQNSLSITHYLSLTDINSGWHYDN